MLIKALNEHNKKKAKNVAENLRLNDKDETLNQGEDYNDIADTTETFTEIVLIVYQNLLFLLISVWCISTYLVSSFYWGFFYILQKSLHIGK